MYAAPVYCTVVVVDEVIDICTAADSMSVEVEVQSASVAVADVLVSAAVVVGSLH